ncbi:MAG: NAD(P)H-dependent oxidoreductase [Bacteroidota bacterium]
MITLICGTNRNDSVSEKITNIYSNLIKKENVELSIIDLKDLPYDFINTSLYENAGSNTEFSPLRKQMTDSEKFFFVIPEYNGSFPGVLKAFIDGLKFPDTFQNKKAALMGISSGMQGAGLALSHFTDILNYMGTHVLANKPKLNHIQQNFDGEELTNPVFMELIEEQVNQFLKF